MAARSRGDLHIKPFLGELRSWKAAARREGVTLTDWVRRYLNIRAVLPQASSGVEDPAANLTEQG